MCIRAYKYAWCVSVGTHSHIAAFTGIYPWRVRVGAHSHAHACMSTRDGVRVEMCSYIFAHSHAFIHLACVSQAKTQFPSDENLKKRLVARKSVFIKWPKGTKVCFV